MLTVKYKICNIYLFKICNIYKYVQHITCLLSYKYNYYLEKQNMISQIEERPRSEANKLIL